MQLFVVVLVVFLIAFAGMAVGVILTDKKELQGSCGGPDANPDCCQTCPEKAMCEDGTHLLEGLGLEPGKGDHPALGQLQ